jgi:hypothetical protein
MAAAEGSAVMLLSEDYADSNVWSWWRRGRVELGLKHGLAVLVAVRLAEAVITANSPRFRCLLSSSGTRARFKSLTVEASPTWLILRLCHPTAASDLSETRYNALNIIS